MYVCVRMVTLLFLIEILLRVQLLEDAIKELQKKKADRKDLNQAKDTVSTNASTGERSEVTGQLR